MYKNKFNFKRQQIFVHMYNVKKKQSKPCKYAFYPF